MRRGTRSKKAHPKYGRISIGLLMLVVIVLVAGFGVKKVVQNFNPGLAGSNNVSEQDAMQEELKPKDITINMVAIGDVMCHSPNFTAAYNATTKTYDFSPFFTNIAKHITKGDISIGNLETTFAGAARGYSGYPQFNSPSELGVAVKNIGIDILSTANNHCMDKGETGVISTLDKLDEIGLDHIGTNRSKEEQNTILVKEVNGIKIAFLSFTYGTNGIPVPTGKSYLVNLFDKNLMLEQINLAKEQEVDVICASMHWGIEYAQKQNSEQESWADFLFQNGVDIIIGNHAHVIQPMEMKTITLEDGTKKDVFVVYALGNFISNQTFPHTQSNAILDIQITKNGETGNISLDKVDYVPVYVWNKGGGVPNRYELLDVRAEIQAYESGDSSKISASLYNTLKKELADTEKVLGDPIYKTK